MDILRFITAGSVDDGKSTLIGRLLYETGSIKNDVLDSVRAVAEDNREKGEINLAHLTDGLRAERAQGITIDVAYKYFTTPRRKYIIADAPGHFQYTKNLVTGASGTDLIIILIDALNGITAQTRKHTMVAAFLAIPNVVVAINKMDAKDYDEGLYLSLVKEFESIAADARLRHIIYIPISALDGDNVFRRSANMPWYGGPTLFDILETSHSAGAQTADLRLSVQYMLPVQEDDLVCCAGKVLSGTVGKGDEVCVFPGGHMATVTDLLCGYDEQDTAKAGQNVTLTISSDTAIARGALLTAHSNPPRYSKRIEAKLCWLDDAKELQAGGRYILRLHSNEVACTIVAIRAGKEKELKALTVNEFADVVIETDADVAHDLFTTCKETGRGILIDMHTCNTSGVFIIA